MIESETLPPEAVDYLNQAEADKQAQMDEAARAGAIQSTKNELLDFCNDFITKSLSWRKSSYHDKWEKFQRMSDGIFDPAIAGAKESWQSKAHVPITASHRESIHAYLFKVMAGTNPPVEISPRFELGEADQSKNIQDIILRELDKARWEVELDSAMHDADTYGSGFLRRYWKTETAIRKLKKPVTEGFTDNLNPMGVLGYVKRAAMGELKTIGYEEREEEVITYRGLKVQHVSIWDVFKTPKSIKINGSTIAIRYWLTYGDIVKGSTGDNTYYLPEAAEKLKGAASTKKFVDGEDTVNSDRGVTNDSYTPPDYGKELECFELFGKLPKKWIYTIIGQEITGDPEELISARVIFHKLCPIAVEMNDEYDGEPPIHQLNYFPKNGDSYGMGIPEMLETPQTVINEIVNQRLDNGAILLNTTMGVIEKALVNPKQDLKSKPGQIIRFDSKYVPNGDVRNVMSQLTINDTPVRAGFSEVNEWERLAQERTSSNRIMQGSTGTGKDGTKTLGEQQLLMEAAGAKFSYVGLLMELSFSQDFFHGVWKTVYKNIDPDDIADSIGPERAASFILITPEEIMRDYIYKPLGVFSMERKSQRQSRLIQIRQQFLGAPWVDDEKFYDAICSAADEDGDLFKKTESEIMQDQAGMIQPEMGGANQVDTTGQPMPPAPVEPTEAAQVAPGQTTLPNQSKPSNQEIADMVASGQLTQTQAMELMR